MQNLKSVLTIKLIGYGSNCEPSCVLSCPRGWEREGDRCYYFSKYKYSWPDAEGFCKHSGGHLASIANEQIHNYVKNKLSNEKGADNQIRWIGGRRKLQENKFVWSDCSSWRYNWGWGADEPNDVNGNEDCVIYNVDQTWYDTTCATPFKFVCSKPMCSGT